MDELLVETLETIETSQYDGVADFETGLPIENSSALLRRSPDSVEFELETTLPEGTYTVWVVAFNEPEACVGDCGLDDLEIPEVKASIFWATGEIIDNGETGLFSATVPELTLPGEFDQVLFGDGVIDSFGSEIHLVVRSHGPAIPGLEEEQITTFNGGCPPNECIDVQFSVFPSVLESVNFDGADLSAGTIITDQFADVGLTVSTSSRHGAMLFDTNNPTGGDRDLSASDLDNVLIISEDGDTTDPDDNAKGGTFTFEWDELVGVHQVGLLDIDKPGSSITFFDANAHEIETIVIPDLGNNSYQELEVDVANVARMDITLVSSGAVTNVDFIPSQDDVFPAAVDALVA
ncbi:MAG: hypothetical protein AAGD25_19500 [Cyanobacteria bacterium P01_F01_bin.150]